MVRSRLGVGLNCAALLLAGVALATIGPFAQSIVLAVLVGLPLAVAGLSFGARRTGILALLSIASALVINPLIVEIRGVEYIAVGLAIALAIVAATMSLSYARAKKSASLNRTV